MSSNDNNPFSGFDFSKFDVQKMLGDFKIPGVDMKTLMSAQEKNIAALKQANQHAAEGLQALATRQMEMMQQVMQGAASAAKEVATSGGPKEAAAKQAEVAKAAFEQAVANMREMAELVSKSSNQAFEVITQRAAEGLEELKQLSKKP
jgi:phasin family protein